MYYRVPLSLKILMNITLKSGIPHYRFRVEVYGNCRKQIRFNNPNHWLHKQSIRFGFST